MPCTRATSRERSRAATTDCPISPVGPVTATVSRLDGPARAAMGALYRTAALPTLEGVSAALASTSIGHSLSVFFDAVGKFFSDLAAVHWGALALALAFFGMNLTVRSRAFFHSLRAAYPGVSFQWRRVWGAYFAAVGFNNVVPARGGDIIKLFLTRSSIPGSRYPTVAAAFFVESIFDATVGVLVLIFAFTQGVFPKPPDFSKLSSFDISYLAEHFRFTLFLITLLAIAGLAIFAVVSTHVRAFWEHARQGVTILRDGRRYAREVISLQV